MIHADGWSSAQEPRFVGAPSHAPQRVAPNVKQQQAQALAAAVEAHLRAGGAYVVLEGTLNPAAPRRVLGE